MKFDRAKGTFACLGVQVLRVDPIEDGLDTFGGKEICAVIGPRIHLALDPFAVSCYTLIRI